MVTVIYGLKGSGKTLYAVSLIRKKHRRYSAIYTNIGLDPNICDNVYFLDTTPNYFKYGNKTVCKFSFDECSFEEDSCLIFDESALLFNARHWESFSNSMLDLLVRERRRKYDIYILCQNPQMVDINILRLADEHILCNNRFRWYDGFLKPFGFFKREHYYTDLDVTSFDSWNPTNSQVAVGLHKSRSRYLFGPLYYRWYNTYYEDHRDPYPHSRDFSQGV